MAKKLIVANWKMHFTVGEASLFLHKLQEKVGAYRDVEAVLAPNMLTLQSLSLQVDRRKFRLAAQNCYFRDEGAFTGEVSATMLRALVDYIIIGHSERRHVFGEDDKLIAQKVQAVLRNGMQPIICVGETAHQRVEGETAHVLHNQVIAALAIRVLYGGSVDQGDAGGYLVAQGIDGLLIGGSSLKAQAFASIVQRAHELASA